MKPRRAGMSSKELAHDLKPGSGNFFFPQTAFQPEFRCQLLKQLADRESPLPLFVGFGQPAPFFDDTPPKRSPHKKKHNPA